MTEEAKGPHERAGDLLRGRLAELGLTDGQACRFIRHHRSRWNAGTIRGVNADGSLVVHDTKRGHMRSLRLDMVEIETRGPRGGRRFEPITLPAEGTG